MAGKKKAAEPDAAADAAAPLKRKQWWAIYFTEDRPIGSPPDPKQHWHKGQLYSTGTSVDQDALPPWLAAKEIDGEPRPNERWDPVALQFVDVTDL